MAPNNEYVHLIIRDEELGENIVEERIKVFRNEIQILEDNLDPSPKKADAI